MTEWKTSTAGFLEAAANAAMKEGAEKTIEDAVTRFEIIVREKVYEEVSKLAVRYAESMYENSDPLSNRRCHIVIDDRRKGS